MGVPERICEDALNARKVMGRTTIRTENLVYRRSWDELHIDCVGIFCEELGLQLLIWLAAA
jgi:hypothetical protein